MTPGKYHAVFVAAAVLALQQAPLASATAVSGSIIPLGSLAVEGVLWGSLPAHPGIVGLFTVLCLIVGSFFLRCATGAVGPCCFCRRSLRALRAFCYDPAPAAENGPSEQGNVRTVGVMSQCHYSWYSTAPRFKSDNQGFLRAGEVTF